MQLHPTRATFHVAIAGAGLVALGAASRLAAVVAFGGAMLLAVAIGRALAVVAVTRLRAAGFEMVWTAVARAHRVACGDVIVLEAELRNRGEEAVRGVALRPIASSMVVATIEPKTLDLPGHSRARVHVTVRAPRVGRWGVHGVALEVRGTPLGSEGMYEVPLLFANPVGLEVVPRGLAGFIASPRGGRTRRAPPAGRGGRLSGAQSLDGDELRELRDHVPGDAFKRIAWKASARRGRLLVREMEPDEREVVWLVVDASVDLWAGGLGEAPLDLVVDDVSAVACAHLRRGDRVGLVVVASRVLARIVPQQGAPQAAAIALALADGASFLDADRSQLDESEVAQRAIEHARPLDGGALAGLEKNDLDGLAPRMERLKARGPFSPALPFAATPREQVLRQYLAAFGVESPPRILGEREGAEATLAEVMRKMALERPLATTVHVWAPPPIRPDATAKAVGALRVRGVHLRWSVPPFDAGIACDRERRSPVADVVDEAVRRRARAMRIRGERLLRRLGVRVMTRPILRRTFVRGARPADPLDPRDEETMIEGTR
ncbi:MAG: DUF58 domain-containing protein [Myxococcota bacterium]|nr:DUF58 domain-containing protein [Myxococcota bacterium]